MLREKHTEETRAWQRERVKVANDLDANNRRDIRMTDANTRLPAGLERPVADREPRDRI